ncbi:lantibiotic dehydratase [Polymorphospora sp. NPDC050346]|uniref:lantibiotic dehydratase n=1 Tax=Polymorphospora sp. NPDC050346 TaxID=3155780 RepID=UPI003402A542
MSDLIVDAAPRSGTHLVPLGNSGWLLWRESVLRSAGFPATAVLRLGDPALAAAADRDAADFDQVYAAAARRLSATIQAIAQDARFREAVVWQNRRLLNDCLDKAARGEPRNVRGRNHELAIAGYLQRYCVKNDTIGFFGPVGWARWSGGPQRITTRPGPRLLARRRVYFEVWAVDAVADALLCDPALRPWVEPRPVTANHRRGTLVNRPDRGVLVLTPAEADLLNLCDGRLSVHEIAARIDAGTDETWTALASLRDRGLIHLDLRSPVEARPEATLRDRLSRIGDPAVRERALRMVDRLIGARDAVADAAGDAAALAAAMDEMNAIFVDTSGVAAQRRHGRTYAGRSLVYEDAVRDVRVDLGADAMAELAGPLGLVLDSARWYVGHAATRYRALFDTIYDQYVSRTGDRGMPLGALVGRATPNLFFSLRETPPPVAAAAAELQQRWARVLRVPPGVRRHAVRIEDITAAGAAEFPGGPPPWPAARHHTPDVMLAADPDALERGDYHWVLGELHAATNTVESRLFVEQHADPAQLLAAAESDYGGQRMYPLPSKESDFVTSRTFPPSALLSPQYTYWALRPDADPAPGEVLPVAAMSVSRTERGLIVRCRGRAGEYDLLHVLGEMLSSAVLNGFKPMAPAPHQPRVTVGRLVLARETWRFPATELDWAHVTSEPDRYRRARAWRADHDLPEHAFYRVAVEDKPCFVDFTSLPLLNLFAKAIRRSAEESPSSAVVVSEMLPDTTQNWLRDAEGDGYAAELRIVALDPSAPAAPPASDG